MNLDRIHGASFSRIVFPAFCLLALLTGPALCAERLVGSATHTDLWSTVTVDRLVPLQTHGDTLLTPVAPGRSSSFLSPLGGGRDDCNGNGIPDECDLTCTGGCGVYPDCGQSTDCQPDGIPDDCQLYGFDYVYLYDDGTSEYGLRSAGTYLAWLNNFTVVGDAVLIDAIDLTYVNVVEGAPAMVYLWSDPDGDGDPADAQVLASAPTTTVNNPGGVFRVDLPDTYVGEAGTSFFVGTILEYPDESAYPCPLDGTAPATLGVSWIIGNDGPIDPNDLDANFIEYALLEDAIGAAMNVVVRAVALVPTGDCNLNGVPDDCDIAVGTSLDVDGNGVPDECEDCNGNDIPDACDVTCEGTCAGIPGCGESVDCQPDGVPDECQLDDNDCNTDDIPDDCQLDGNDCNENGVPDECDIASGTSQDLNGDGFPDECDDCNGNGIPDTCDLSCDGPCAGIPDCGLSADCQPDGIPDDCQWGTPDYETYAIDDGTSEAQAGSGFPADICWLNHFTIEEDMETVAFVEVMYSGGTFDGGPVTIVLWDDPNGDGSPADAQVITSVVSVVTNGGQGVFVSVPIGDNYVGPVGTSFFVGAIYQDVSGAAYPILRDTDSSQGESWLSITEGVGLLDPNDLDASPYFGNMNSYWGGNCMIRARAFSGVYPNDCNENEIPDECDVASGFSEDIDGNGVPDECEDCNGNGIPDGCDLTCDGDCGGIPGCGQSDDCDGNGVPDECDILGSDCNNNGIPDTCDVPPLGSYSEDCNEDLIPDECQLVDNDCNDNGIPDECDLGGPPIPLYILDDGSSENSIGLTSSGTLAWLNHFTVLPNGESIKAVRLAYGDVAPGTPVAIYLWNDPDGNGDPTDAQVIASASTTVVNPGTDTFSYVDITETYIGPEGTSFFAGAIIQHSTGEFPAPIDQTTDEGESWLAGGSSVNPNNLSAASLFGQPAEFGFAGNWLVQPVSAADPPPNDCNGNGVPDECDIAEGGASEDCNENGVPDECDVPPLGDYSLDCNGNLEPDECELADHDCDGNGIPDDCQPEDDCDDNGLLDICELDSESGLVGQYWRSLSGNGSFSQRLAVRVDPTIDFDWGGGVPHPDVPANDFAVRWTGLLLTPPASGIYTFYAKADDGVRLWINGEPLIDEWHPSSGDEYYASIALLGDYAYHIRLDYFEGGGDARVYLRWSVPGGAKETVPTESLYPMQDCDGNEVPDFCDLGGISIPQYTLDDGTSENTIGLTTEADLAWLNHFVVEANGESLEGVRVAYGDVAAGTPVTVHIWTDPNGDGNPADAQVLASVATTVQNPNTDILNLVEFPETYIGEPGTSFFVGALIHHQEGELPAPLDQNSDQGESWLAGDGGGVDPDDLSAAGLFGTTGSFGFPGNWLVRAVPVEVALPGDENGNGVLDECEDCNNNGVFDDLDVSGGFSEDCNSNGLPDECEVVGGNDCNDNGVPDDCELDEFDCDNNGIHDACQAIFYGLVGHYFGNDSFSGTPYAQIDSAIDFDWGDDSPAPGIPDNDFTVRWTGSLLTNSAGTYYFRADRDDGFRLYINNLFVFEGENGSIDLPADTLVFFRAEYWENSGGARVTLYWTPPGESEAVVPTENLYPTYDANDNGIPDVCEFGDCNGNGVPDPLDIERGVSMDCDENGVPDECQGNCDCDGNGILETCEAEYAGGLVGQYWSSDNGAGNFTNRLLVRVDPTIDFNWGGDSPGSLIPNDNFSVRWTGTVTTTAAAGTYAFYTLTDDGVRLWVDEQLLIDEWHSQSPTEWSGSISLVADTTYLVKMEYFESGGGAEATLSWQPPGGVKEVIPTEALGPMADADGDGVPDDCPVLDCNDNGVPDLEDILLGTSEDCNDNCTPDECDIVPPPFEYGQAHWRFEEAGGSTVLDSGPNGLDGTLNALPFRTTDVPVDPVPQSGLVNTQSLDLSWQSTSSSGFFNVSDTGGALSMGNQNFTIEAWVKLDHLSSTSSNDERQFLCQKKPLPSQDGQIDYAFLVQRGNSAGPSPNYGKTSGFSGRELQLYFGTGSSTSIWGATSHLELNDLNWHFVSVAYDTVNNVIRFGIDDTFETVSFSDNNRVTNGGPLRVGSHQNGSGVDNFFLRGTIDEMRISRGVVPVGELLDAEASSYSDDANGNGIPDECEGPSCPTEVLFVASPPSGTIDARKPHPNDATTPLYGIGMPDDPATAADEAAMTPIVIDLGVTGADAECFTLCETPAGSNAITEVTDHGDGTYTIKLAHGAAAGVVTTVQYDGGSYAEYIHHPANVDGSSFANANDITVVVDCLNSPGTCLAWREDVDFSSAATANDIIETVDLLNGAGAYAPGWYNTQLPENTGECP